MVFEKLMVTHLLNKFPALMESGHNLVHKSQPRWVLFWANITLPATNIRRYPKVGKRKSIVTHYEVGPTRNTNHNSEYSLWYRPTY
jgi:hypothetical protein